MNSIPLPPLTAHRYQFHLTLHHNAQLPTYLGAMLRGGFGLTFKRFVCMQPQLEQCDGCLLLHTCAYPAVFQPVPPPDATVLTTHQRIPVPYILQPPPYRTTPWKKDETIPFGLTLFGNSQAYLPYFVLAFQQLAKQGLGAKRTPATLTDVYAREQDNQHPPLWHNNALRLDWQNFGHWQPAASHQQPLALATTSHQLTIDFQTPTRLKYNKTFVHDAPPFHVLFRTLLRRVSSLSYFYAHHQWDIDYRAWIEQAKHVQITHATAHWQDWSRYSTRQQRRMNLGGLVGRVTYEAPLQGNLAPFLPLIRLGEITQVGKNASFGNGRFQIQP